jgi:hypothetical protein
MIPARFTATSLERIEPIYRAFPPPPAMAKLVRNTNHPDHNRSDADGGAERRVPASNDPAHASAD